MGQQSISRHYPSRHYHNTPNQCDTTNISNKKVAFPDNKGIVSILTPTDGNQPSVISHISSIKDNSVNVDTIQLVSNPNRKDCVITRQQQQHLHPYSSTLPIPSNKTVNLRCHQNEDGSTSDTSTIQKSVHFEKLPYLQKVEF